MEEGQFNYFSSLIKMSCSNHIIIIILVLVELNPFLSFFIESPLLLKKYIASKPFNFEEHSVLQFFRKVSFYHQFTKLRNKSNETYPLVLFIVVLLFLFLFVGIFFGLSIMKKRTFFSGTNKVNIAYSRCEAILTNVYDLLIFRALSVFIFELLVNYLFYQTFIYIQVIMVILLIIILLLYYFYFLNNRLCVKFSSEQKYVFDNQYMELCDYIYIILKIIMCLEYNNSNNLSLIFAINCIGIVLLIYLNYGFLQFSCINVISCVKGGCSILFLLLFIFVFVFEKSSMVTEQLGLYFFVMLIFSCFFVFLVRNIKLFFYIIPSISNSKKHTQRQFELVCEYYDTPVFDYFFKKICFTMKIIYKSRNLNEVLNQYFKKISKMFKHSKQTKKRKYLFYYILTKIFRELMTNKKNTFGLMYKTWDILQWYKQTHKLYYLNLRYFYQKLCNEHSTKNNCNFYAYNNSYYSLYSNINKIIESLVKFLDKKHYNSSHEFIEISKEIKKFQKRAKQNFSILSLSSFKDEYQRIIFRIIIEGILNKPINKTYSSLIIQEEIGSYEELLDKQFNSSHQLVLRLDLLKKTTQIIKIGKIFSKFQGKKIEYIFPKQFQSMGVNMFFKHDKQIDTKNNIDASSISNENFHFILWDNASNLKTFSYIYKIYHNISSGIAYVDGLYQLGKEDLLVTEIKNEKEYLYITSNRLACHLLINQNFINLLGKYQIKICLNDFLFDMHNYCYMIPTYYNYLTKIKNHLLTICHSNDVDEVNTLYNNITSNYTPKAGNSKSSVHLIYKFTLDDEKRNASYRVYTSVYGSYTINFNPHQKGQPQTGLEGLSEKTNEAPLQKGVTTFINDNNSVSSSVSQYSSHSFSNTLKQKIKADSHKYKKNNLIIIICNVMIIIISVSCLLFENESNSKLKQKLSLLKSTFMLNRLILNTLINFFSMFCTIESINRDCENHFLNYINKHEDYKDLFQFIFLELQLKVDQFSENYLSLKNLVEQSGDPELVNFFQRNTSIIHIVYDEGIFNKSYYTYETFDYAMMKYINLLISIVESEEFLSLPIQAVTLDENFFPLRMLNESISTAPSLSVTQLNIYEVVVSYLHYSNTLFEFQRILDNKSESQANYNKIYLSFFVIALIASNILIMSICLIFFKSFESLINKKFNLFDQALQNEQNISLILKKFKVLSDLSKLFLSSPTKLIYKLNQLIKKKNGNQWNLMPQDLEKEQIVNTNTSTVNQKKFDAGFLLKKFKIILICFTCFYIGYCWFFYSVYTRSFDNLDIIIKVIQCSSYMEEKLYLTIGLVQIFQYISFPTESLTTVLSNAVTNSSRLQSNYFEALLDEIQSNFQSETLAKNSNNIIPGHKTILVSSCDTFLDDVQDSRFTSIVQSYPERKYEEQIIKFCKSTKALHTKRDGDKLLVEEVIYSTMSLLLIKDNYNSQIETKHDENELYFLISEILFVLRPLRRYYGDYYFKIVLDAIMKEHFFYLTIFLIGNIFIQVIYFVIIKFGIIDQIETILDNLEKLQTIMNC